MQLRYKKEHLKKKVTGNAHQETKKLLILK